MRKLYIVGCSGHGKVAADIAVKTGKYDEICFLDDNPKSEFCMQFPVVGNSRYEGISTEDEVFIAIGNPQIREKLMGQYEAAGFNLATLIHPDAVIGMNVKIGRGTVVMAGAVINPGTEVGNGVIINTCSSVDLDCEVSDYVHVAVGSHLCGTVTVGHGTWIGAGVTVSNNVYICPDCVIGAGAVVVHDILENGTYIGIPAKRL